MFKPITVLVATGVAVFAASSLAGAAKTGSARHRNAVTVVAVLGPSVSVPPEKCTGTGTAIRCQASFAKAFAICPKGYYVTGGGAYGGAITEIVSSPMPNLRGWFVDGSNTSTKTTFQHRADAVCVKGSPAVTVGTAAAANGPLLRQAEVDFASSHSAPRGR
jgi:hypothetical protein